MNLPRLFPCAPGIPPFINGLFDSPRAGYVILLAGMALGFLAKRSQDDEWDEDADRQWSLSLARGNPPSLLYFVVDSRRNHPTNPGRMTADPPGLSSTPHSWDQDTGAEQSWAWTRRRAGLRNWKPRWLAGVCVFCRIQILSNVARASK